MAGWSSAGKTGSEPTLAVRKAIGLLGRLGLADLQLGQRCDLLGHGVGGIRFGGVEGYPHRYPKKIWFVLGNRRQ
ncbi:hypothetical protein HDG38_005094 [Paraburkholderia sp. WSM4177]|nr:hypothetical protein [Paraburkholderia sp. WSM4177]MBB5486959.1 hypothetical protein [Paraburkholderia sp. WSM4180]